MLQFLPWGQSLFCVHPQVWVVVLHVPAPLQFASVIHATQAPFAVSQYGALFGQSALEPHCTQRLEDVLQCGRFCGQSRSALQPATHVCCGEQIRRPASKPVLHWAFVVHWTH